MGSGLHSLFINPSVANEIIESRKRVSLQLHYESHDFVLLLAVRYTHNNVYSLSGARLRDILLPYNKNGVPLQANA